MGRKIALLAIILGLSCAVSAQAQWKVLDARWRPDENPWAKQQVWDGYIWSEGWPEDEQFYPEHFEPAGSVHVILRNDSDKPDTIALTHIDGIPVEELTTTPSRASRVIWHWVEAPVLGAPRTGVNREDDQWQRTGPTKVQPGRWAECAVRFRSVPKETVRLRFRSGLAGHMEVPVAIEPPRVRVESISFSPQIDRIYAYIRSLDGKRIKQGTVWLDGHEVGARWTDGPKPGDLILAEAKLEPAWKYGSHHLVEVEVPGGVRLAQPVRAWDGFFTIGMYGTPTPEKTKDAKAHGINTYFTAGVSALLDEMGLNYVHRYNVGEGRIRTPAQTGTVFYQNWDEPDAHDFGLGEELPVMQRLGVHAQRKVLPFIRYQRTRDPRTPNMVLVDNTYKPLQWYVYGQIPDVYCTDPYVPLNGRQVDYVWHALETARDSCTPRPLVSILWACSLGGSRKLGNRAPTPEEERMMVFYALGCGVKGLAYFIDVTTTTGEGEFVGLSDIKPLWEEVGRTNRDTQALAPYLSIGCPMTAPQQTADVWWRALMCGRDDIVVIVVNRKHYIGFETRTEHAWHTPAEDVELAVALPGHFRRCRVREVKDGTISDCGLRISDLGKAEAAVKNGVLHLKLGSVDTARAFVISASR